MNDMNASARGCQTGFRDLKVVAKLRESSIITSFHLDPVNPNDWSGFEPGQFLILRLPVPSGNGALLRSYSISCSPAQSGRYRITVKREGAREKDLKDGLSSCFLHDHVKVGDVLSAQGPRGDFVLDMRSDRPVVFLSGGVGLTPLVSMLHALADSRRRVTFLHACDNGEVHALREEVERIAESRAGIAICFCYRHPTEADRKSPHRYVEGVISRELLQGLLPLDDYDFYMCGPPPFMTAVYRLLRGLGVPKDRIAYEFFGPATLLEPTSPKSIAEPALSGSMATEWLVPDATTVEFRRSGIVANWSPNEESLLSFAEKQGLSPEFSCRSGICMTCRSRLIAGEVAYFEEPLDEPAPGEVLICCSRPKGPVVLDI